MRSSQFATLAVAVAFGLPLISQQPIAPSPLDITSSSGSSSSSLLPDAPSERRLLSSSVGKKPAPPPPDGAFAYFTRANFSCGSGATVQTGAPQTGVAMCGLGFTFLPGVQAEFGGIGPQGGWPRFYISADGYLPLAPVSSRLSRRLHGEPLALAGYTKMFYNSNDLDFGLAWDHHVDSGSSVVYEVRDYVQLSSPVQHTVMFRMNFVGVASD